MRQQEKEFTLFGVAVGTLGGFLAGLFVASALVWLAFAHQAQVRNYICPVSACACDRSDCL